jgi:hypothetical protein
LRQTGWKRPFLGKILRQIGELWTHFFDINIQQFENLKILVDNGHTPNSTEINALESYNQIQHYYRNIAHWLAKRSKQNCFRIRG